MKERGTRILKNNGGGWKRAEKNLKRSRGRERGKNKSRDEEGLVG